MRQRTSHIMMVRPAFFGYNEQTAESNAFQNSVDHLEDANVQGIAMHEFDAYVTELRMRGVTVSVINDSLEPKKPDAIFPNNWVTFHEDGTVVLYPMCTPNRRWERRRSIIDMMGTGYVIKEEIDLSHYEADDKFLEGTGSMILDRENRICYACNAIRTDQEILKEFCEKMNFEMILFDAVDPEGTPIYHTNVMMGLATDYVVICMESIQSKEQKQLLLDTFKRTNKELVDITHEQVTQFCGNVIELENDKGESLLVMSEQAERGFTTANKAIITKYSQILSSPLFTIETVGGGGARCMVAEVFLPPLPVKEYI